MKARILLLLAIAGIVLFLLNRDGQAGPAPYRLEKIAEGFEGPVHLTHAGDGSGRVFVVEQRGRIRLLTNGKPGEVFLDIHQKVVAGGEMGLLSVAFHPKFRENGRLFVNYTTEESDDRLFTIISEVTV